MIFTQPLSFISACPKFGVLYRLPRSAPAQQSQRERPPRDMVKKGKSRAGTRSEAGRRCRDTFISLKKTCWKHGLSFWEYLHDRGSGQNAIPRSRT